MEAKTAFGRITIPGIVFAFLIGNLNAQVIPLDQAIETALKNNEKIKQVEEKLQQKKYADLEAWGNFLPSLNLKASYTHLNDPLQIDLNPIREAIIQLQTGDQVSLANLQSIITNHRPLTEQEMAIVRQTAYSQLNAALPSFTETFKDQDYKTASLIGVQPLFLGGKLIAAKKFASAEVKSMEAELQKTKNEVVKDVVTNYLSVVLLQQVIKTRKDVLAGMKKHRRQAQILFKEGLIARTDVLRAKVAVAEAERNLFDDQNRLELAYLALKHSLGLPEDAPVVVSDSLQFHVFNDSLQRILNRAQKTQPILRLIAAKKKAAEQKFVAERAEFLPQLAAFGKYEMYPEYLSSLEPRWAVGVSLQFNVFDGFKKYDRIQSSRHLKKEVDYLQKQTERQIELWINKSYREMRNAEKRYHQLAANIELAKENLKLQEKRFQSGMGTSLNVIDARLVLEKNRIERLNSLYEYYKALTDLLVAEGNTQKFVQIWK
ncbi:MAG: TolC family protein [Calditrichaeota bacterium]|nr:TolC family protein [Calditrichota bacterium]